jgi:hypothetical protein
MPSCNELMCFMEECSSMIRPIPSRMANKEGNRVQGMTNDDDSSQMRMPFSAVEIENPGLTSLFTNENLWALRLTTSKVFSMTSMVFSRLSPTLHASLWEDLQLKPGIGGLECNTPSLGAACLEALRKKSDLNASTADLSPVEQFCDELRDNLKGNMPICDVLGWSRRATTEPRSKRAFNTRPSKQFKNSCSMQNFERIF